MAVKMIDMNDRDLARLLFCDVDKPDRIDSFFRLRDRFGPVRYWKTLREIWINSESLYQHTDKFPVLFGAHPTHRPLFMNLGERQALSLLSFPIHIYRGGWGDSA